MALDCFQDKPFNITVIQASAQQLIAKRQIDRFCENLQHLLELKPKE